MAEAKNRLPELIRAVEGGEKVVITRRGKPVAEIAPPPARAPESPLGWHEGPHRAVARVGRSH
ncbi:MAG: type II toxin-antitoxin system prevent-host-death family antitoxin [Bryobacteraceae bacterium]